MQSCLNLLHRKISTKGLQTKWRRLISICFVLLRCFLYLGSYLCLLSFSEASCLPSQSANSVCEPLTWKIMIHHFSPKCLLKTQKPNLLLLPSTNTWGKASNNFTVSMIEACLKWGQCGANSYLNAGAVLISFGYALWACLLHVSVCLKHCIAPLRQ